MNRIGQGAAGIALLLLLIAGCSTPASINNTAVPDLSFCSQYTGDEHIHDLASARQEYDSLICVLATVPGTSRKEVEAVYGPPLRYVEETYCASHFFIYSLKTEVTDLWVRYEDDKVIGASIKCIAAFTGEGNPGFLPDDEMLRVYRLSIAVLRYIRATFWEKLIRAPWVGRPGVPNRPIK
jgi:hypothetical protein